MKRIPAGHKHILKIKDFFQAVGISQPGIGIIAENQVYLSIFQEIHTSDGGLICDFDMNAWKFFVKTVQIGDEEIAAYHITSPDYCLKSASPELFPLTLTEELPRRQLVIVHNEHLPLSSAAREFIGFFASSEQGERKAKG